MELKQFISNALLSITQGIDEANKTSPRFQMSGQVHHEKNIHGEYVEFDIAVEVSDSSKQSSTAGIGVSVANIGGDLQSMLNSQSAHKLKFRVFVTEK